MTEAAAALEVVARTPPGEPPFQDPAFRALFALAEHATGDQQAELVRGLLPGLDNENSYRASCVAITCGTLVEMGAEPSIAGLAIMQRLRAATEAPPDPSAIQMFCLSAMAHLCRRMSLRVEARRIEGLVESLEPFEEDIAEAGFVRTVLGLVDDLELVVLAPVEAKGYRVRLEAVASNFHLFTLLQGALIGDGRLAGAPEDPELLAVARGEQAPREALSGDQRFHFHNWSGLATPTTLRDDLGSSIWGGSPLDIPELPDGGPRVVLLGPTLLGGRSWDSNFFANIHDALRSSAEVIETLSPAAVQAQLEAILVHVREMG